PVRAGESGFDLLGCLASETAWSAVMRRASPESLLPADRAVDHGRLVAGRADVRAGRGGFPGDSFEAAGAAAAPERVPTAAAAEVRRAGSLPASSGRQRADHAALVAGILRVMVAGIAGHADRAAVVGAGVDPALASASGAGLDR